MNDRMIEFCAGIQTFLYLYDSYSKIEYSVMLRCMDTLPFYCHILRGKNFLLLIICFPARKIPFKMVSTLKENIFLPGE